MSTKGFRPTLKLILDSLLDQTDLVTYKVDGSPNVTTLILRFSPREEREDSRESPSYSNATVPANMLTDVHDEWWFYLLAGLLGLIALVLLLWLLSWCCCSVCGCCEPRGSTISPHTVDTTGRVTGYRRGCWCCLGSRGRGPAWDCCSRKPARSERPHNTNTKGVYWIGSTNAHGKWEPGSPCTLCHSHNTLASSGLSSASSPHSGCDPVRAKNHAHSHPCRGHPAIGTEVGFTGDETNGNSSRVAEMYGGSGLAAVETPSPREAQLTRPVKHAKEPAKDAKIWMPHSNPIRQINTSTK